MSPEGDRTQGLRRRASLADRFMRSAALLWPGETIQLTGTVLDGDGRTLPDIAVVRTSGDESVVTVDATGLVTAVGNGVAAVRAAAEGMESVASVHRRHVPRSAAQALRSVGRAGMDRRPALRGRTNRSVRGGVWTRIRRGMS